MAQSYFPTRVSSPVQEAASFSSLSGERQLKVEDVQEAYIEQKDRLIHGIDATKSILRDIRAFNKDEWVVRYPQLREQQPSEPSKRHPLKRSLSFADDPAAETEVMMKPGVARSFSMASMEGVSDDEAPTEEYDSPKSEFNVLRLDLKIGANGSSTSAASLVSQLEKASIANLLDERILTSLAHIDKLRLRVEDTSSKVLVTGDLNAGKSTFVNALLRREVMPVDQQPCTTAFCEVHDAAENQGKEEVHILKDGVTYDPKNESTFTRRELGALDDIVGDNNEKMLKLYLADTRTPTESLLNNGVVDISLIDAPGLNRDSLKTTAVFARQEEIDVVVFVVSAENHFTLSAKEFLWNASNEKAYLFIVVNKYDQIKNKDKCRRLVLEQIKQLSPRTYEDAEDLVHFVDSASALQPFAANPAFDDLESSLRSFVLVKRSKSKLQPVSTYLSNLLSDIDLLAGANAIVATNELKRAKGDLEEARPVLDKMKASRDVLEDGLENLEESGARSASARTKSVLSTALDRVGDGKLAVTNSLLQMPTYPGLLSLLSYARAVRRTLLLSIDAAVKLAEDEARVITTGGVEQIKELGDVHLPEGVERSRRVFMPEAMFSALRRGARGGVKSRASSSRGSINGTVVAGGTHGLGIGLAQRPDMLETTFFDIFDVQHQFWVHFGHPDSSKSVEDDSASLPSALSLISVGAGALTMVGGQAIGVRGLIEGFIRLSDVLGNESTRKWVAPVLGAATLGLTAYVILELPNSIPKTVGRRVRASIEHANSDGGQDQFVETHAIRISRETRKVLRLASWDLRERFRGALEERSKEVKVAEELERKATKAKEWFTEVGERTHTLRVEARLNSPIA